MKLAIMQPYFLPYIGYFQLMEAVDCFVVYDNIQFTKKGWINRNRFLLNGVDKMFTLPLKKDSDYLDICQRKLADSFKTDRKKLLSQLIGAYQKSPFFDETHHLLKECLFCEEDNLFRFILHSLSVAKKYLGIKTKIITSSSLEIDHTLKGKEKVISICMEMGANDYINPQGGTKLYDKADFEAQDINLSFIVPNNISYPQFNHEHVPWLSILDVMMFNERSTISEYLSSYNLL